MEDQIDRIKSYLEAITAICQEYPSALQMAIANFNSLLSVMKAYERAPRMFNARLEETQPAPRHAARSYQAPQPVNPEPHRFPVIGNLEMEFGRKLKQKDLVAIAKGLTGSLGLKLEREVKRKKEQLIEWFDANWQVIEPKVKDPAWRDSVRFPRDVP
jgi:hypothetical protein